MERRSLRRVLADCRSSIESPERPLNSGQQPSTNERPESIVEPPLIAGGPGGRARPIAAAADWGSRRSRIRPTVSKRSFEEDRKRDVVFVAESFLCVR